MSCIKDLLYIFFRDKFIHLGIIADLTQDASVSMFENIKGLHKLWWHYTEIWVCVIL